MYRHGDRSPTHRYPLDPVKESDWPQGYGQLSKVCELNSKYLCKKCVLADLNKIFFFFSFSILTDIKNLFFIPFDNYLNSVYSVIFQPMFFFFCPPRQCYVQREIIWDNWFFPVLNKLTVYEGKWDQKGANFPACPCIQYIVLITIILVILEKSSVSI